MKIHIADQQIREKSITFSMIDFGKSVDATVLERYCIEINDEEVISQIAPIYQNCIDELKRDDEITGQFDPPYPGAIEYPSFRDLLQIEPSFLRDFVSTYLIFDIFKCFIKEEFFEPNIHWIIRTVDEVSSDGKVLLIRGLAQPIRVPGSR